MLTGFLRRFLVSTTADPPRRAAPSLTRGSSRLEEPLPFRPTADVLCRRRDTIEAVPAARQLVPIHGPRDLPRQTTRRKAEVDLTGQDCAGAPWVRRHAALSPERLESCRTPRMIPRADALCSGVATRARAITHPFAPLAPRHRVNSASAPTGLDQPDTREPCDPWAPPARDASSQLVHSTFSKTSTRTRCGCQLARKRADEAFTSRRLPRFGWVPLRRVRWLSHRPGSPGQPLTSISPAEVPDAGPGPSTN